MDFHFKETNNLTPEDAYDSSWLLKQDRNNQVLAHIKDACTIFVTFREYIFFHIYSFTNSK